MALTVDQLREHVTSGLGDDALQRLLDAAYVAIAARIGASGTRTELAFGGFRTIALGRPASSVTGVTETVGTTTTTLNANDYRLRPDTYTVERLSTGTNSRWAWAGAVEVTYTAVDDDALRDSVAIDLVRLALTSNPGLTSETIGAWTEQYASNAQWNSTEEYQSILSRLESAPSLVVVGETYR